MSAEALGAFFRDRRVARGLSLAEVARTTRVSQRYLEALEAGALSELPAPVFTKGFIRAYCQVLDEPADEPLGRYRELIGEHAAAALPGPPTRAPERRWPSPVVASLVLLIALGGGLFALTLFVESPSRPVSPPTSPASTARPRAAPVAPAPETSIPREGGPARLVARATEPTWISVRTDSGQLAEELLPAGATREWISARRFVLTIGNAGGISLELNGQPLPPLGASGSVIRELVLPPEPESASP